jgi:hypothetical protein
MNTNDVENAFTGEIELAQEEGTTEPTAEAIACRNIDENITRYFPKTLDSLETMIGETASEELHGLFQNDRSDDSESYCSRQWSIEFLGKTHGYSRNRFSISFQLAPLEYCCALGFMEDLQVGSHWMDANVNAIELLTIFAGELKAKLRREGFAHGLLFAYSDEEVLEQHEWATAMGFETQKEFISYKTTHNIRVDYMSLVSDVEQGEVDSMYEGGEHYEEEYF